jgi:hypothetical protein
MNVGEWTFGNMEKSRGAKSDEYDGWSDIGICFMAKNLFTEKISVVIRIIMMNNLFVLPNNLSFQYMCGRKRFKMSRYTGSWLFWRNKLFMDYSSHIRKQNSIRFFILKFALCSALKTLEFPL